MTDIIALIIKIICAATCAAYFAAKFRYSIHMLQQESYLNISYFKWVSRNIRKNISIYDFLPPLAALCVFLFTNAGFACIVWAIINVIIIMRGRKNAPKTKKPLVYTARVKRLVATACVFGIAITAGYIYIIVNFFIYAPFAAAALSALMFVFTAFVNIINRPIELAINRYYVNDARKIVKNMSNLRVIGITGSFGKTSSKFILAKILSEKFSTLATPESYNTTMGVVITIRKYLKRTHQVFVCEMGAKYVGDIKEICDIVSPEYGWVTSIGPQHLETFKSVENIVKTKYELVDALKSKSKAVLNVSSDEIKNNIPDGAITYSLTKEEGGMYYAENISYNRTGVSFTLCGKDITPIELSARLLGKHNILNIIGAAAVALDLGMTADEIAYAVRRIEPIKHRLELKTHANGVSIIDDAFNSNVEGAKSAVEVLGSFEKGKRMLITPGMIELGEKEFEYNCRFGTQAAQHCDFIILVGEKQTRPILKGIKDAGFDMDKVYVAADLTDAINKMNEITSEGWTVLFENDLPDLYV